MTPIVTRQTTVGPTRLPSAFRQPDRPSDALHMDVRTAEHVVRHGMSGSPIEYDLVQGLAAHGVLHTAGHSLASQAALMYDDAIQANVSASLFTGPAGAQYDALLETVNAAEPRTRRRSWDRLKRAARRDYRAATEALHAAIEAQLTSGFSGLDRQARR